MGAMKHSFRKMMKQSITTSYRMSSGRFHGTLIAMASVNTTGLSGLDVLTDGLHRGDNVVWRVDALEEYRLFCRSLAATAVDAFQDGSTPTGAIVYFRFAQHPPLFSRSEVETWSVVEVSLPLDRGFEFFITRVHHEIVRYGERAVLFFDSLSDLSQRYYSDRMIGNFFQLTCPLILKTGSVAYFSLERFFHSYHTVEPITDTTQILMDVFRHEDQVFVQPVKLDGRPHQAAFTLFRWERDDTFRPVTASADIVPVLNTRPWPGLRSASYRMVGVWDRVFLDAETRLREVEAGREPRAAAEEKKERLLELIISREERVLELARENLSLADVVAVWKRMVGTGHIGGKSVGMLLARAILNRADARWRAILEEHDSFFVGSDVYYTFLVINDCWWDRQRRKNPKDATANTETVRRRILNGVFPAYIVDRFSDMLDYFGTSPIIVRSSSLLEDNFGNAFAGKYESVFCTMQGSREERLNEFLVAVRRIYASTVSEEALAYRKKRGILDQDEQMALLVQRVSGDRHETGTLGGRWFFPHLAGVAFSYNPWAWHRSIDPDAGLVRLVFGLGTRAVDRVDDDYTRVVALNAPERRPDASPEEVRTHSQRRVDLLDLHDQRLRSVYFVDLLKEELSLPLSLVAIRDRYAANAGARSGTRGGAAGGSSAPGAVPRGYDAAPSTNQLLTFDRLLAHTTLVRDLRDMLSVLRDMYRSEVDVEFTVNLSMTGTDKEHDASTASPYRINVVQCRPLQVQGADTVATPLPPLDPDRIVLRCGAVVGHSRELSVHRVVYVKPEGFASLSEHRKRELARVLRHITTDHSARPARDGESEGSVGPTRADGATVLIGPGRWGTSTPALGIPVQVQDIGDAAVLVELDRVHSDLVTDLSLGTHFFNEMVEENLLYLAYREAAPGERFVPSMIEQQPNTLRTSPGDDGGIDAGWADVIHVADLTGSPWTLNADSREQRAVLFIPPG